MVKSKRNSLQNAVEAKFDNLHSIHFRVAERNAFQDKSVDEKSVIFFMATFIYAVPKVWWGGKGNPFQNNNFLVSQGKTECFCEDTTTKVLIVIES